jgi:hypothetical protein
MTRLALLTVGVLLLCTGTARAAITGSAITTPADPTFSIVDLDGGDSTFTISGTTRGGGATDKVDIRCYTGSSDFFVRGNVPLNPDGSFSTSATGIDSVICRLRAIPAGTFPSDLTPFAGPRVATGRRETNLVQGGPNAGAAYDFYLWGQQQTAAFEYDSLGSCGLFGGDLFDATLTKTTETFNCNAWFDRFADADPATATRSGIRIDGADAYPPTAAARVDGTGAGLPAVAYSYTLDPGTGNLAIHVAEPVVKCADPAYPPTTQSCATFLATGVTDTRTVAQDHDGHLSTITDVFSSTDGAAHALDLLWENDQRFHGATGDSTQLAFRFPGQSAFAKHAAGDVVALTASPGTILIHMDGAPDGDPGTGQGAIVYDRPADAATFIYSAPQVDEFDLHQTGTVPAGGSTTYRFAYAQDYTAAGVAALAGAAAAAFGSPAVPTSGPAPVPVTQQAPPPVHARPTCGVPALRGKTLKAAKRALVRAHCRTGRVTRKRSRRVRAGRVISTSPAAHTRHANGTKVKIRLSRGR